MTVACPPPHPQECERWRKEEAKRVEEESRAAEEKRARKEAGKCSLDKRECCRAVASTHKTRLPALEALRLVLSIGKNRGQKFDRTYQISRDNLQRKLLCLSL
jgi:hypothetical protein